MRITIAFEVCLSLKNLLCRTQVYVEFLESSDILHRATATAAFTTQRNGSIPPNVI